MTSYAEGRAGIVMVLTQTGPPSRTHTRRDRVGIFQPAVTPHAGDGVDTVLGAVGTADVYRIAGCSRAIVTVDPTGPRRWVGDIHIIRVGIVETGSPGEGRTRRTLSHRLVGVVIPEAAVALGALSLVVRSVRVELVRRGVSGPEGYRQGDQRPDRERTARRN
jgi:hypothetical protein